MEPIITAKGIETGLHLLLDRLCHRLQSESMGLQQSTFKACREDGTMQQLTIGTNRPSRNAAHLFRLFALKIVELAPGFGFVLFVLEAGLVSALSPEQETLWSMSGQDDELAISDLLDRIRARAATSRIQRFLPQEHYWPERAMKPAGSLAEQPATVWRTDRQRPVHLLPQPQRIEVTVPLPDYPPMLFKYKGNLHQVKRADGPERIEPEWWLEQSPHRDYYCLEDEQGARYWVFRLGHYDDTDPQWFIHGFFA